MTKMTSFRGLSEDQVARAAELAKAEGFPTLSKWLVALVTEALRKAEGPIGRAHTVGGGERGKGPEYQQALRRPPGDDEIEHPIRFVPGITVPASRADAFRQAGELAAKRRRALKGQKPAG